MIQKPVRLAPVSVAHGLFLDQSHDNPTPIEVLMAFDTTFKQFLDQQVLRPVRFTICSQQRPWYPWHLVRSAQLGDMTNWSGTRCVRFVKGFGRFLPLGDLVSCFQIHVVSEKRPYAKWGCETNDRSGIIEARRVLNELHLSLARANYTQAGLGVPSMFPSHDMFPCNGASTFRCSWTR